jgi:hypothetical protein
MRIGKSPQLPFFLSYFLYLVESFLADDGRVGVSRIILRKFTIVVLGFSVFDVGFLKERISGLAFLL